MTTDFLTIMRSMDAAADISPDPQRREALCEQIMATPRAVAGSAPLAVGSPAGGATAAGAPVATPSTPRRGWMSSTRARLAAAGGAVAAGVAAFTFVGGGSPAYAAWSATPEPVSAHDLRVAETACGASMQGHTAPLILTERRGDYVLLERATDDLKTSATCVISLPKGAEKPDGGSGGSGLALRGDAAPKPAVDGLTTGGTTQFGSPPLGVVSGLVGRDVRRVIVHVDGRTMQATVHDGHYAAAWTGDVPGGGDLDITYDITLADGRVLTDVESNDG